LEKTKAKKDELLKQILQEISDENNTIDNSCREKKIQNKHKKMSREKKIENILIIILVILIIFILFYPNNKKNNSDHNVSKKGKSGITKVDQTKVQKQTVPRVKEKTVEKEAKSERTVKTVMSENKKTEIQEKEVLKIPNPKTQREKAKEMLMKQMKN